MNRFRQNIEFVALFSRDIEHIRCRGLAREKQDSTRRTDLAKLDCKIDP